MLTEKDDDDEVTTIGVEKNDENDSPDKEGLFDPSNDDEELDTKQKVNQVINNSFGYKFTEDELIHLAPAELKTGFYIDPKTIDKNGRFKYMFCMDMNGYDEVEMIESIRNLMDSELMTNPKDGQKREAQFLDFGSHVLRISRDQFEGIVTDPEKCKAWAASLGRVIKEIKTGFDGAEDEKATYPKEAYPMVEQINPDADLEASLSVGKSLDEVIKGKLPDGITERDLVSGDGGL